MKKLMLIFLLFSVNQWHTTHAMLALPPQIIQHIGKRIWHRECGGSYEKLICWNNGEEFPSLGIGHFIWYPAGKTGPFTQTFPALLDYLIEHHIALPHWLVKAKKTGCPWHTQQEFLAAQSSERMKQLHTLLRTTIELQSHFIIVQTEKAFTTMMNHPLSTEKKEIVQRNISLLKNTPHGLYALIDYAHFKGIGINPDEHYHNQGWGLLHVLKKMTFVDNEQQALQSFVATAKNILIDRVKYSPPQRNEARWLPGWLARVESYLIHS